MQELKNTREPPDGVWTPEPMHCPNCGQINIGYKNKENKIRYECSLCKVVLVRTIKSRRHDTIEMYAPAGEARLY